MRHGLRDFFPKHDPGRFLSWASLVPYSDDHAEVEIGWRVARAAWGNGYAPEAAAAVLRYGLKTLRLNRVMAFIHPENAQSRRVAQKLGMALLGDGDYFGEPCKRFAMDQDGL